MSRSEPDADGGQHNVDREQCDHAEHHGFVDGGAETFRSAADGEPAVAADEASDESERCGLIVAMTTSDNRSTS